MKRVIATYGITSEDTTTMQKPDVLIGPALAEPEDLLPDRPYGDLSVGMSASLSITFRWWRVYAFAFLTRDWNPIHWSSSFIAKHRPEFNQPIVHGVFIAAIWSRIIGTKLPGQGTVVMSLTGLEWSHPVYFGDTICFTATITKLLTARGGRFARIALQATNKSGTVVAKGTATTLIPS